MWRKVAVAGDGGKGLTLSLSAYTKVNLQLVAYDGTSTHRPGGHVRYALRSGEHRDAHDADGLGDERRLLAAVVLGRQVVVDNRLERARAVRSYETSWSAPAAGISDRWWPTAERRSRPAPRAG